MGIITDFIADYEAKRALEAQREQLKEKAWGLHNELDSVLFPKTLDLAKFMINDIDDEEEMEKFSNSLQFEVVGDREPIKVKFLNIRGSDAVECRSTSFSLRRYDNLPCFEEWSFCIEIIYRNELFRLFEARTNDDYLDLQHLYSSPFTDDKNLEKLQYVVSQLKEKL